MMAELSCGVKALAPGWPALLVVGLDGRCLPPGRSSVK